MENLNKEYFDRIRHLYPEAMDHFTKWLEQYKVQSNWDRLFRNGLGYTDIDFFDLPYDMQNGIMARYDIECFHGKNGYMKIKRDEPRRYTKLFIDIQDAIDDKSIKNN